MTSKPFKPMLAGKLDPAKPEFPCLASVKLDGIRCLIIDGRPVSRNLKDIPNDYIRGCIGDHSLNGFDGELIVCDAKAPDCYQVTSSGVMSQDACPPFSYWVFDLFGDGVEHLPYTERFEMLVSRVRALDDDVGRHIVVTSQERIDGNDQLLQFENAALDYGYEGVMLRSLDGQYKRGRATTKSRELLKLKRFSDKEALVIGVEELMSNQNVATRDLLGHTERSTHKAGMVGMNTLGALVCRTPEGVEFRIGTGFTAEQRADFWARDLTGMLVKYKSFDIGVKDAPRFPVFIYFRNPIDTGEPS